MPNALASLAYIHDADRRWRRSPGIKRRCVCLFSKSSGECQKRAMVTDGYIQPGTGQKLTETSLGGVPLVDEADADAERGIELGAFMGVIEGRLTESSPAPLADALRVGLKLVG